CFAQVHTPAQANSASHVAAEMIKGSFSTTASKPGDTVAIRLTEDVRSNGEIVFRKGTAISGIIRSVNRAEDKGDWKSEAQSMIDVEWLVPAPQGRGVRGVSFTIQSVIQHNRVSEHEQNNSSDLSFVRAAVPTSSSA